MRPGHQAKPSLISISSQEKTGRKAAGSSSHLQFICHRRSSGENHGAVATTSHVYAYPPATAFLTPPAAK